MYIGKKLTSEQIQSSLSILYRKDYILIPLFLDNYTFSPTIANNYTRIDIYTNIALEIIL